MRFLITILTTLSLTPLLAQTPTTPRDPGEMTPSTYQGVPLKYGAVDAVSGSLDLQIPLGPRLPGRLPWGFNWVYESHNFTHQELGGEFRPVVWPRSNLMNRLNYTVILNNQAVSFAHNFYVNMGGAEQVKVMLQNRTGSGNDLGYQDACNETSNPTTGLQFQADVHPSTDGSKFLVVSGWTVNGGNPTSYFGKRMTVLDGVNTIWTDFKGVSHVVSAYGDHLTITEQGLSHGGFGGGSQDIGYMIPSGTITMANSTGHTLTLGVTPEGLTVANNMGYPQVDLVGKAVQRTRDKAEDYGVSGLYSRDFGFIPNTMSLDSLVTTFAWLPVGAYNPPQNTNHVMLSSITHPNGLTETLGYSETPIRRYADYAYRPDLGQWTGFSVRSSWITQAYQYRVINQVVQDWRGQGKKVMISRVGPDWTECADASCYQVSRTDHITTIRTYPTPDGSGPYRDVRLTHFPMQGGDLSVWGAPGSATNEMTAAFLFATSAIKQIDFLHADGTVYKSIRYGWYDTKPTFTWAKGVGVPNPLYVPSMPISYMDFPAAPRPGSAEVTQPNLPVQTYSLITTRDNTSGKTATVGHLSSASLNPISMQDFGSVTSLTGPCVTFTNSSLALGNWLQPLAGTQSQGIQGDYVPNLREVSGTVADLGTAVTQFDSLDRPTQIATTIEGEPGTEVLTYTGNNPSPDSVTVSVANTTFSGQIGKRFTYGSGPHYWKTSETDILTNQTTSITPDAEGREIERLEPNGIRTSTEYDSWGRLWRKTIHGTDTVTKTYTYDNAGLWMKETVNVADRTLITQTEYDGFGRVINIIKPDGSYQDTIYNGFGEKTGQSPWLKADQTKYGITTWEYDGKGRMIRQTDPQNRVILNAATEPAWDATVNGVVSIVYDDRNLPHKTISDLLNQKRFVIDPLGNTARFSYNAQGRLSETYLAGRTRQYRYTPRGWLISRLEPEEGETTYGAFTAWGFPTITTKKGLNPSTEPAITLSTELDNLGRPINLNRVNLSGDSTRIKAMAYDPKFIMQLAAVQSFQANGTLMEAYQYDDWGRQISKTVQDDGGRSFTVSRTLDGMGNMTSLDYPTENGVSSRTLTIAYDAFLRPSNVTLGNQRGRMDYDQVNGTQVANTLTFGNGAQTFQVFDKGELTQVQHRNSSGVMEESNIAWTAGGLLLSRGADTFGYDALGRLNHSEVHGFSGERLIQDFTYDAVGNRIGVTSTPQNTVSPMEATSWSAFYNVNNQIPAQLIAPGDGNSFYSTGARYDNFGRLTQIQAVPNAYSTMTNWSYDDEDRITQENGNKFLLDAQGLRFRRVELDGTTTYVVYGFNREPLSTFVMTP